MIGCVLLEIAQGWKIPRKINSVRYFLMFLLLFEVSVVARNCKNFNQRMGCCKHEFSILTCKEWLVFQVDIPINPIIKQYTQRESPELFGCDI